LKQDDYIAARRRKPSLLHLPLLHTSVSHWHPQSHQTLKLHMLGLHRLHCYTWAL